MCDCRVQLLEEARNYITQKVQALNIKKYLKTYTDLETLQEEVKQLDATLEQQKRSISVAFTINDDIRKQITSLYQGYMSHYSLARQIDCTIEDEIHQYAEQITAAIQRSEELLREVSTIKTSRMTKE